MEPSIGASVHANSLIDLLKIAHLAHNKDKNNVCSAIDLSEKTIVEWYNEISLAYAPFRTAYILGKKMSDAKSITDFLVFAESRTNSHAIESSLQYFDQIKVKWGNGELRKLAGEIHIETITNFKQQLKQFHDLVFDTKMVMLENGIPKLEGTKEDAVAINNWIKKLDDIRSKIRTMSMKILQELKCNKEMFNKISNH